MEPPLTINKGLCPNNKTSHPNERGRALAIVDHGQGFLLLQMS